MTDEVKDTVTIPRSFGMIWTSFGLGDNEAFDPTLAYALATMVHSIDYGLSTLNFTIPVTDQRHDLKLLGYLQKSTTKEVFIETSDARGAINPFRLRFMVTSLQGYNGSHHIEQGRDDVQLAYFSVGGSLEVITD